MELFGLLLLSIVPSVILFLYFYYKDTFEREPRRMLLYAFLFGVLAIVPAIILELLLKIDLPESQAMSFLALIYGSFIGVALVEEGIKYIVARVWVTKLKDFTEFYDGILYTVCISLGFATLENILYVVRGGILIGVVRAFMTVPMHVLGAVIMGYYISSKKFKTPSARFSTLKGLGLPILLHGVFNFVLSTQRLIVLPFIFLILGFYIIFIRTLFAHLRQFNGSLLSSRLVPPPIQDGTNTFFATQRTNTLFWLSLALTVLGIIAIMLALVISYVVSDGVTAFNPLTLRTSSFLFFQ